MTFAVLTAAQGAILRNRIGDTIAAEYKLSDTVLDACYTAASLDLDGATVEALQQLLGLFAMYVNVGGSTEVNEQRGDRYTHLKELLKYWETKAGTAGGKLTAGVIDYNIDTDYDDLDLVE